MSKFFVWGTLPLSVIYLSTDINLWVIISPSFTWSAVNSCGMLVLESNFNAILQLPNLIAVISCIMLVLESNFYAVLQLHNSNISWKWETLLCSLVSLIMLQSIKILSSTSMTHKITADQVMDGEIITHRFLLVDKFITQRGSEPQTKNLLMGR